ncbi:MAG: DNA cytosine methyltransferase [Amphritea sp.]|nr:DNA cytosine methyltransferase [Amphritea sp.]
MAPKEQSRGESWMPNISEWPNDANVSLLSQVLVQTSIPQKYFLSSTACAGILRRAEKRGKTLPELLQAALEREASQEQTKLVQDTCSQQSNASGGGRISGPLDAAACLVAKGQKNDFEVETFAVHGTQDPCISSIAHCLGTNRGQENAVFHTTGAGYWQEDAGTLRARSQDSHENLAIAFAENSRGEIRLEGRDGQRTGALSTGGGKPGQGTPVIAFRACGQEGFTPAPIAPPIIASSGGGSGVPTVLDWLRARRLMPIECERLQGFTDNHTMIPWRNKPAEECPDGPRYKAIGNSMATRNMKWLGLRIDAQTAKAAAA